jgi:hypothetical protein
MDKVSRWRTGFAAVAYAGLAGFNAWQGAYIGTILFTPLMAYYGWRTFKNSQATTTEPRDTAPGS